MCDFIFKNKLIYEKSPYLLHHAHNPVNWFPWGREAFSLAKEQNKPIFLSIGCFSSSWNGLIFEESFKKEEIAELMNLNFINIKMDKEEYPHLANLYLDSSKILLSGSLLKNNCSLNIVLTPNLFPFFSIHKLFNESNFDLSNVYELIKKVILLWEDTKTREYMIIQSQKIVEILSLIDNDFDDKIFCSLNIKDFISLIYKEIDLVNGGVKSFPKYLHVNLLRCLLHFSIENQDNKSFFFVNRSLDHMSRGSIFDHIRGGFYRYTVDDNWLLPSLEKVASENASLSLLFLEMYSLTKIEDYKKVALLTLDYLIEELQDPDTKLFYLSESVVLEGKESFSHTCSYDEIQSLFKEDANLFCEYFGIYKEGFFDGRNILRCPSYSEELAISKKYNLQFLELKEKIQGLLLILRTVKKENISNTFRNTQSIVHNNGFIAYSLIQSGLLLGENKYIDISEHIVTFIQKNMYKNNFLLRIYREDENKIFACLEDYASVILSSIALFEAGRGKKWLSFAYSLMEVVITHFKSIQGGFYSSHDEDTHVILRRCNFSDKSIPSENSLIAEALIKFYYLFDDNRFLEEAIRLLEKSKVHMKMDIISSVSCLTIFLKLKMNNLFKIVILLDSNKLFKDELESLFLSLYFPNKVVLWLEEEDISSTILFTKKLDLKLVKNKTTIFLFEKEKTSRFLNPDSLKEYLCSL